MKSVTLVRRIAARPSIVFAAMTTAEGVSAWWGPDEGPVTHAEVDARVGGTFRVRFRMVDGHEHEASGDFVDVVPPRRVVMSWRWTAGGEPDEVGRTSRIEIDLAPIATGTEVTFTHAELVTDLSRQHHEEGWSGSFDKLARHLEATS
jgi:uncharacterized protein YndB with AHSA1/START domain